MVYFVINGLQVADRRRATEPAGAPANAPAALAEARGGRARGAPAPASRPPAPGAVDRKFEV